MYADGLMANLLMHIEHQPEAVAFRYKTEGKYQSMSYAELGRVLAGLAEWLAMQGLGKGDRAAILSENSLYWALADLSIISVGAISVAIYPTLTPRDVHYILENSESKIVFVQNPEQYKKVQTYPNFETQIRACVVMEELVIEKDQIAASVYWMKNIIQKEASIGTWKARIEAIAADDPICIIYTSGTTGPPKGAVLTHGNIAFVNGAIKQMIGDLNPIRENLSFLPLSHALERIAGLFFSLNFGKTVAFAESLTTIVDNMKEIRPTHAVAVPRVFEKIYERITTQVNKQGGIKKKIFWWSVKIGKKMSRVLSQGKTPNALVRLLYKMAYRLVFAKLNEAVGGNLKYFISGGAPLAKSIAEFFHAAGILVLEGWGATELSAPATWNCPSAYKFGSVGKALPGVEIRVAEDGELLVRGPNVFREYWKREEATREAKDSEGWYHTGDIGFIDAEGWVYITDRKKELMIKATGKDVSPANIENIMKSSPYISNIMVYGDRRKYIVGLVNLEKENVISYLKDKGIEVQNKNLHEIPEVWELVEKEIERLNGELARFEQIKKFAIVPEDFSVENDMLTPTMKLKRRNIIARYKDIIDSLYEGELYIEE
ncbi:MAG: long-chain fatty acid--CoA ligase [Spirochaetes bacterium]|nr:long-chain fatty acid--CoA ligase [Spirochaetota bacterium]